MRNEKPKTVVRAPPEAPPEPTPPPVNSVVLSRRRDSEARALSGVEPLIRPAAAAALLAISRGEIYRLAAKGLIPWVRVGEKMIRFRASELQAYIRSGSIGRAALPKLPEDPKTVEKAPRAVIGFLEREVAAVDPGATHGE